MGQIDLQVFEDKATHCDLRIQWPYGGCRPPCQHRGDLYTVSKQAIGYASVSSLLGPHQS